MCKPFLKGYLAMDASWNMCFVIEYDARYNVLTQHLDTFLLEVPDRTAWVVMAMPTYPETVGGQPPWRLVTDSGNKMIWLPRTLSLNQSQ